MTHRLATTHSVQTTDRHAQHCYKRDRDNVTSKGS